MGPSAGVGLKPQGQLETARLELQLIEAPKAARRKAKGFVEKAKRRL